MALQTTQGTSYSPSDAFNAVRSQAFSSKVLAQSYLTALQTTSVDANWVFNLLDQIRSLISVLTTWAAVPGLDAYATAQGYTGSLSSDITTVKNAAAAITAWIFNNFPKDAQGFAQAVTLNSDGTRTIATFAPAATTGLQTVLSAFIATIS
jgi:hypothetical protein